MLSVSGMARDETKRDAEHRANKDRKKIEEHANENNFISDDGPDIDYDDASVHRKRLKPIRDKNHEKAKKEDDSTRVKRKKKKGDKKQELVSSSQELPDEDDYNESEGQMDEDNDKTVPVDQGPKKGMDNDKVENLDDSVENFDSNPTLENLLEKESDRGVQDIGGGADGRVLQSVDQRRFLYGGFR